MVSYLLLTLVCTLPEMGKAQNKINEESLKKHTLNFEDELIEGGVQKPELLYLLQRKNFNFKKLIRLRENFLPEMVETGERLRGSGRSD
jgi:hypothetical protein